MRGSAEYNIIFANECNKFSNKWQRIWDFIYYITVKTIGISIGFIPLPKSMLCNKYIYKNQ